MDIRALAELLGNFGEFFGSIAVVATLIYFALQVNQSKVLLEENRKISLSQVYQSRVGFRIETYITATNPLIAGIIVKVEPSLDDGKLMERFGKLSKTEQVQYVAWQGSNVQVVDNSLYQYGLGLLNEIQLSQVRDYTLANYEHWKDLGISTTLVEQFHEDHLSPS